MAEAQRKKAAGFHLRSQSRNRKIAATGVAFVAFVGIFCAVYFKTRANSGGGLSDASANGSPVLSESSAKTGTRGEIRIKPRPDELRPANRDDPNKPDVGFAIGAGHSVTRGGMLTSATANRLDLTDTERRAIQERVSQFWKQSAASFASRAYYDQAASEMRNDVDVYNIPASSDRGAEELSALEQAIAEVSSDEVAGSIVNGLDDDMFAGFGKYDTRLEFSPDYGRVEAGLSGKPIVVNFTYVDPQSGHVVRTGRLSWKGFSERFGEWSPQAED